MNTAAAPHSHPLPKLGIIAGASLLPKLVISACEKQGRDYFVIALDNIADETLLGDSEYETVRLGAIGKAISTLKANQCKDIIMAGRVKRPSLANLRPDLKATKLLARLGSSLLKGDDQLLRHLVEFLEDEGFNVVGVQDVAPELVTPEGLISTTYPNKHAQADIEYGAKMAKAIGELDIGQAVIVQGQLVLGVEAAEGTAELIRRCAEYKHDDKGGVLVKVKKPNQEDRVDLPTIGIHTIEQIADAGFAGIAAEAGSSLMLDRKAIAKRADELGVFVVGFSVVG